MILTGEQIRARGLAALRRELGRAGLAKFLRDFGLESGDYTQDREKNLNNLTMNDLRQRVSRARKKKIRPRA